MDATAALHAVARNAGRTPAMNAIMAEIAIRLESANAQVLPEHLSGTLNFECDALSRLSEGADLPATLRSVLRVKPRDLVPGFFLSWPKTLLQTTLPNPTLPARLRHMGSESSPGKKRKGKRKRAADQIN